VRFLRSVKGYTRLDKIRSEVIRKELKISGIQEVRSKYKKKIGSTISKEWAKPDCRNTPQEKMAMRRCRNRSNDLIPEGNDDDDSTNEPVSISTISELGMSFNFV
jgi:hypothetical protein